MRRMVIPSAFTKNPNANATNPGADMLIIHPARIGCSKSCKKRSSPQKPISNAIFFGRAIKGNTMELHHHKLCRTLVTVFSMIIIIHRSIVMKHHSCWRSTLCHVGLISRARCASCKEYEPFLLKLLMDPKPFNPSWNLLEISTPAHPRRFKPRFLKTHKAR